MARSISSGMEPALWALFLAASCIHSFYWTVTSISFCCTRLYYLGLIRVSRSAATTAATTAAIALGWIFFVIATIWCLCLTPIHIFTPTLMDIWTPHLEHPPLTPVEILYDAGEKATVEYVLQRFAENNTNPKKRFRHPWTRFKPAKCLDISRQRHRRSLAQGHTTESGGDGKHTSRYGEPPNSVGGKCRQYEVSRPCGDDLG